MPPGKSAAFYIISWRYWWCDGVHVPGAGIHQYRDQHGLHHVKKFRIKRELPPQPLEEHPLADQRIHHVILGTIAICAIIDDTMRGPSRPEELIEEWEEDVGQISQSSCAECEGWKGGGLFVAGTVSATCSTGKSSWTHCDGVLEPDAAPELWTRGAVISSHAAVAIISENFCLLCQLGRNRRRPKRKEGLQAHRQVGVWWKGEYRFMYSC